MEHYALIKYCYVVCHLAKSRNNWYFLTITTEQSG